MLNLPNALKAKIPKISKMLFWKTLEKVFIVLSEKYCLHNNLLCFYDVTSQCYRYFGMV